MGGIELICIERRGVCGVLNLGKFSSERRSQAYGLISFNADAFRATQLVEQKSHSYLWM
jgi:hypothetical protein